MQLDAELLKKTGVFGLVSGELLATIGGGYWIGNWIDKKFNTAPVFVVVLTLAGLSYSVWRIQLLSKQWLTKR